MATTFTARNPATKPKTTVTDTRKVFNCGRHHVAMVDVIYDQDTTTSVSIAFKAISKEDPTNVKPIYIREGGEWTALTWEGTADASAIFEIPVHPGLIEIVADLTIVGTDTGDDTVDLAIIVDDDGD